MIDVSDTLDCFLQAVTLKTVTITSVDFNEARTVAETPLQAVIQPADMDKLIADNIDWSLSYFQAHTKTALSVGQYINYNSKDFKIIGIKDFSDYGYYESLIEEVKEAIL